MVSFPLGGVAAGSIGLGGRGQLRDWQIFNRPDQGMRPGYAFAGIWAQAGDRKPVARVLESRIAPPYDGDFGLNAGEVSGLLRLEKAVFTGEYPVARIDFRDRTLPVSVALEAFSPFIPLDAEASGLPVALMRYRVTNTGAAKAKVSIVFSLDNPVGIDLRTTNHRRPLDFKRNNELKSLPAGLGLLMTNPETPPDSPLSGSFAIAVLNTTAGGTSYLRGWPRVKWWASPLRFWDDFSADGILGPESAETNGVGSICLQREIAAGAEAEYTFLLAWHFPNRTPEWCGWGARQSDWKTNIGNHYCQRFRDAWHVAEHVSANLPSLEHRTRSFVRAIRESTIPAPVKEAAMANLSTLATPTVFRTADGKFWGFEGITDTRGCCDGNCTHVWSYESATQYLFPTLARSMRETAFSLVGPSAGVMPARIALPEGKQSGGLAAADGTMGQIIKTYLDWRLSGDGDWLKRIWPGVRECIEFCWIEGGWDADQDGVAEGVQHNTYDVEFYGPNPMCGIYYLGALAAGERMASAVGEDEFASHCRKLRENGARWIDSNLFNGEYYIQQVRGVTKEKIAKPLRSSGGGADTEHPDFQVAGGCLVDQLVGQYVADYAGIGPLLDPRKVKQTLRSIYKYNYKRNLYDHESLGRTFAVNDESALVICDYAKAARPRIPFPYFAEIMTGFEYSAAILLLSYGMVREGVECIENIRRRYDGARRNPWDEAECGRHYARAMASWSGIPALSGFRYNGPRRELEISPKWNTAGVKSFWSTAAGWGTFELSGSRLILKVIEGKLLCRSIKLHNAVKTFPQEMEITPAEQLIVSVWQPPGYGAE